MKKKDVLLIIILLVIAGSTYLGYRYISQADSDDDAVVVVTIDGKEYGTYPLNLDTKIEIPAKLGTSILEIKNGEAKMIEAQCPDQTCVIIGAIHNTGQMIICLPNRIIVEVKEGDFSNIDSIVQ
ncbi:NusG domain II-containing protein [Clostridium sp. Marseille-P299]|uniref:NusG domain II-containing protein n=1 Tax=Clostridium sp. Marseille-P299 TaxID=1805477 RepID=UPI00082A021D|nr:NusG domain II-containing protein [Clostridium sp. Marseille-P299]